MAPRPTAVTPADIPASVANGQVSAIRNNIGSNAGYGVYITGFTTFLHQVHLNSFAGKRAVCRVRGV